MKTAQGALPILIALFAISASTLAGSSPARAQSLQQFYEQGVEILEGGMPEEALGVFEDILDIDPEHKMAWYQKSICLFRLEKYESALEAAERTLVMDASFTFGWNIKGNILEALERPREALACYDIALDTNPWLKAVWLNRGILLNKQGLYLEAEESIGRAIQLGENSARAYMELG
ncbi:unnamed protein product, partial [marine sediment metagenome]